MKYLLIPLFYLLTAMYCVVSAQDFTFNYVRTIVLHEPVERAQVKGAAWITEEGLRLEINGEAHTYTVDRASKYGPRTIITTRCGALIQVFTRNERIERIVVNEGATTTIFENASARAAVIQDDVIILRGSGVVLFVLLAIAYLFTRLVKWAAPRLNEMQKESDRRKKIYDDEYRERYGEEPPTFI